MPCMTSSSTYAQKGFRMIRFTEKQVLCLQCEGMFVCVTEGSEVPVDTLCPRCFTISPGWTRANILHVSAFYSLPPWRLKLLQACSASGIVSGSLHASSPNRECLDCHLLQQRNQDSTWVAIHTHPLEAVAREYGVSIKTVRTRLAELSGGQCRELGGG